MEALGESPPARLTRLADMIGGMRSTIIMLATLGVAAIISSWAFSRLNRFLTPAGMAAAFLCVAIGAIGVAMLALHFWPA